MTAFVRRFMPTASALALLAMGGAALAAGNPAVGTWELNTAKSTMDAKGAPRSETFTFSNSEKGITLTSNVTAADGKQSTHTSDPTPWDGVAHPTTDSSDHDSVMAKTVGPGIVRYSFMKAGAVVNSGQLSVSRDGTMLTIAGSRTSAKNGRVYYNSVFDRK
jgi:hypothetical protein